MASGRIVIPGYMPAVDSDGVPIPDAQIFVWANRTTTLATVYSDSGLTTPMANPVLADSSGQFPPIWQSDSLLFSVAVFSPTQGNLFTQDDLSVSTSGGGGGGGVASVNGDPGPAVVLTATDVGAVATSLVGAANGVAPLGPDSKVPSAYLPAGSGSYKGVWNASTNTPTIVSGVGTSGDRYDVGTAGSTNIDGISTWAVGDQIVFNGTVWQKVPNTAAVTSVAGKVGVVTLVKADVGLSNVDNTTDLAKPISTLTQTALNLKAPIASPTFTGELRSPTLWNTQGPSSVITGDYGLIDRTATTGCFAQGVQGAPITTESYNRPAVYIERHVAGRNSQIPTGLTDDYLDSNWLLAPTFTVQTIVSSNGSNANASGHFRIIANTAAGSAPTATGGTSQAVINGSVNCLCATVHSVHVNAPGGTQPRSGWAINSEVRWTTGTAPENLVIMEGDLINTGGGANSCVPSGTNNFTGLWMQSAPRGATSIRKAGTTAFYVSCIDFAGAGWMSAMSAITNIFQYGIYINNLNKPNTAGLADAGVFVTSSGNGFKVGYETAGGYTEWCADLLNTRTSASAGGLNVTINRANDDTVIAGFQSPNGYSFYATADATNPVRMKLGGSLQRLTFLPFSSLVAANKVVVCL